MAHFSAAFRLSLAAAVVSFGAFAATAASAGSIASKAPPIVIAQDDPDAQQPVDDPSSNAALLVRVTRLEERLRDLTGQIEELQHQNRKLQDDLRKMSQDVDFRFQDLKGGTARPAPQKRSDAGTPDTPPIQTVPAVPSPASAASTDTPPEKPGRGDAFDPAADPNAPGAPKPLGTTAPSAPLPSHPVSVAGTPAVGSTSITPQPHAPLDLTPSSVAGTMPGAPSPPPDKTAALEPGPDLRGTTTGSPAGGTRADYDQAFSLYKSGQYDAAISGFQDFLGKYPKDRFVPDATYFLGESFARLGRQREAAEQFLKISTDYNRSTRAPDALLRLGVALNALGAKEQACATYQEVDRKYPGASADVRAAVDRELKRSRC